MSVYIPKLLPYTCSKAKKKYIYIISLPFSSVKWLSGTHTDRKEKIMKKKKKKMKVSYITLVFGAPVAQWVKCWPADLADRV